MSDYKWDMRFLELAQLVASWSKDPSTKVGAVLVRPDRTIVSTGYNGFPRGCNDCKATYANREQKYARVVHAELNAILMAGGDTKDNILYCTLFPCCECAKAVVQTGISTVVVPSLDKLDRYYDSMCVTEEMFQQSGITFRTPTSG